MPAPIPADCGSATKVLIALVTVTHLVGPAAVLSSIDPDRSCMMKMSSTLPVACSVSSAHPLPAGTGLTSVTVMPPPLVPPPLVPPPLVPPPLVPPPLVPPPLVPPPFVPPPLVPPPFVPPPFVPPPFVPPPL